MSRSYFSQLSVKNLGTLVLRILEKAQTSEIKEIEKSKFFVNLKNLSDDFQQSLIKRKGSNFTATVEALDAERDKFVSFLRKRIDSFTVSYKPEEVQAAEKISQIFSKMAYGIESLSYSKETQAIIMLISELRKADYQPELKTLDLTDLLKLLEQKNNEFEKIFATRDADFVSTGKTQSATNIRKALQAALTDFLSYVSVMVKSNETPDWISFDDGCNKAIENIFSSEDRSPDKTDTDAFEEKK